MHQRFADDPDTESSSPLLSTRQAYQTVSLPPEFSLALFFGYIDMSAEPRSGLLVLITFVLGPSR
jgi:hypothetical protein